MAPRHVVTCLAPCRRGARQAVFLGYLDVKDNEMYSRAPKFVIYEQKEFNKEKKEIDEIVLRPKHGAPPSCPNEYVKNTNF